MKKSAVLLLLLMLIATPAFAAKYQVPVRSVYPGKNYVRTHGGYTTQTVQNQYERNYDANAGSTYNVDAGTLNTTQTQSTYGTGAGYNYGTPQYNYRTPSSTYRPKSGTAYQRRGR